MSNEHTAHTRALLIGPFPPPVGGDTVLTANLSRSRFWSEGGIVLDRVDTSAGDRVRLPDERLGPGDLLRGARIVALVASKLRRSDVVLLWCNNRFVVTAGLGIMLCCRVARRPLFVKVFGGYLAERLARLSSPWRRFAVELLRGVDCVFAETKALERELVAGAGLPAGRVALLPNYIPSGVAAAASPGRRFSGKCVFFGQMKREKGIFEIVEAIGAREAFSCDFYGPFAERDRRAFHEAISGHPNLRYRGVVEPGSVIRAAREYDVLLLPTFHPSEGYPAVILEAYAAGIPVVATRWRSIPEIVIDGETGLLVSVHSPSEIIGALDALRAAPGRYETMCRKASEFVRSFSEEEVVGRMLVPAVAAAASRRRRGRRSSTCRP
jgi:glycosyltransferase involved in cell wall biosynthesis